MVRGDPYTIFFNNVCVTFGKSVRNFQTNYLLAQELLPSQLIRQARPNNAICSESGSVENRLKAELYNHQYGAPTQS